VSELTIPLVAEPKLRASLRRLYPEYAPIVQAWLIAEPDVSLPPLYDRTLPIFNDAAAQEAAFTHSLETLQSRHPTMAWEAKPPLGSLDKGIYNRTLKSGTPSETHFNTMYNLPDGAVVEYRHNGSVKVLGNLTTVVAHEGLLDVELWEDSTHVVLETRPGLRLRVYDNQTIIVVGRDDLEEDLADGSPNELRVERGVTSPPSAVLDGRPSDTMVPEALQRFGYGDGGHTERTRRAEPLLARWRALASPEDQARIAAFWLGHPHPVLATAGLAIAVEANALLTTPAVAGVRRVHA
jgi:hypothetical protein